MNTKIMIVFFNLIVFLILDQTRQLKFINYATFIQTIISASYKDFVSCNSTPPLANNSNATCYVWFIYDKIEQVKSNA